MSYNNASFSSGYKNPIESLGIEQFGSNKYVAGGREFLSSNTIVAKFAFILLVVLGAVFLIRFGTMMLVWLLKPDTSPYIVYGKRDGSTTQKYNTNPKNPKSIPISRSRNERDGVEFTWTIWLKIKKLAYDRQYGNHTNNFQHIFSKGGETNYPSNKGASGDFIVNSSPGLYLKTGSRGEGSENGRSNSLVVTMNTFNNPFEKVEIEPIPLKKWIHVAIRQRGKFNDVYINGVISKRTKFSSPVKQNYGNVFTGLNGGFDGEISNLQYHNYALTGTKIAALTRQGPNLKEADDSSGINPAPNYFAMNWYIKG